jgi:hypothetical protein
MSKKSTDALMRSDRVLTGVMAVMLAAGSAALGAAAVYHPHTDLMASMAAAAAPAPAASQAPQPVSKADGDLRRADYSADADVEDVVLNKLLAEHRCLAEALYYEARGEGVEGQKAVAEVIFHRLHAGNFGRSICDVVYAGAGKPGCQFSFACNGDLELPKVPEAWMQAQMLAARILTGEERMDDETDGAISYHAVSVNPDWANYLQRTVQIGNHVFYKNPPRAGAM